MTVRPRQPVAWYQVSGQSLFEPQFEFGERQRALAIDKGDGGGSPFGIGEGDDHGLTYSRVGYQLLFYLFGLDIFAAADEAVANPSRDDELSLRIKLP